MSANTIQHPVVVNLAEKSVQRKLKQISAWVDPDIKNAFSLAASENNTTESALLNRILMAFLKINPARATNIPANVHSMRTARVTIRLTVNEEEELTRRSVRLAMSRSRYLASLFRTHVTSAPYFSDEEMNVLRELTRQMGGIGRNINQIAKALNTSIENAHLLEAVELAQVHKLIMKERDGVAALIMQNLRSWQSTNENK